MTTNNEIECAIESLGESLFDDNCFHDLTLVGNDGVQVSCVRNVIAARCKYFKRMLYGSFNEASSKIVKLDQSGEVLRNIVTYLHTNEVRLLTLQTKEESNSKSKNSTDDNHKKLAANFKHLQLAAIPNQFENLAELYDAAIFFDLPSLSKKIQETMQKILQEHPEASFLALSLSVPKEVGEKAWENVRFNKGGILQMKRLVQTLCKSIIELVLKDAKHTNLEYDLFKLLQLWAQGNDELQEDRQTVATELCAKHIHLDLMDATELSGAVAESGLITESRLFEEYKAIALSTNEAQMCGKIPRPRARRRLGSCITVEGAGSKEVNGVYYEYKHYDYPLFCKYDPAVGATTQTEPRLFFCLFRDLEQHHYWYICKPPSATALPGTNEDIDYYFAKTGESSMKDEPPISSSWKFATAGKEPTPTVQYFPNNFGQQSESTKNYSESTKDPE
mmetsp:Transcript_20149/g.43457  ORF Transcript_20149/g.43457 Transcript_20149/m.43457 type:complete len:448 (+) Transcript_20149:118-1461(+)